MIIRRLLLILAVLALSACQSKPAGPYGYTDSYLNALKTHSDTAQASAVDLDRFLALFSPLNAAYIEENGADVYAETLYFNDTLATLYKRDEVLKHLSDTSERLDSMQLTPLSVVRNDGDVYIRWLMEARFSLLGKARLSRTIGISQLRFNQQGQVVFQQDFWDSSQGLDQHLPVLGPMTRWLREH